LAKNFGFVADIIFCIKDRIPVCMHLSSRNWKEYNKSETYKTRDEKFLKMSCISAAINFIRRNRKRGIYQLGRCYSILIFRYVQK
jgi:hypothetical protein